MTRAFWWFFCAAALWVAAFCLDTGRAWVRATDLPPLNLAFSTEVRDRDGRLLRAYTVADGRWRMAVDLGQVDPNYIKMLIAYEDKRFWHHNGLDSRAMMRAAWQALSQGRIVSGGSTLTMQVARLLEEGTTGQLAGKLRQIRVALALEQRYSKQEILALYLNLAPFGGNIEGIRAATRVYLGKEPTRLTPAEAALMVAIPQAPEKRRPDRHQDAALAARTRVLARALRDGVIAPEIFDRTEGEEVPARRHPLPMLAPHLADRVVKQAPNQRVHHLTLDARLQKSLEQLAQEVVAAQGKQMQIALMLANHQTGEILASVGSAGFEGGERKGFIDMTQARRSPGSTLKPLIYGLAFDEGLAHPETMIDDAPVQFGSYAPQNFDRHYRGTVRVREALQLSLNIPVVLLTDALGPSKLVTALQRAGIKPVFQGQTAGLAIALGGVGVTLEELVQLYSLMAEGGSGQGLVYQPDAPRRVYSILSPPAAWQVGDILAGLAPPPGAPENRLAYKTGTSYGHRDAWALGFDGRYVAGVWLGRADGTPVPGVFGADVAAPVLFQMMGRLGEGLTPLPPPPAATLLVSNPQLPQPLRRFRKRDAAFNPDQNAPKITFPPDGAEVESFSNGILIKFQGGEGPFTLLINGKVQQSSLQTHEILHPISQRGLTRISIIDAQGQSAAVTVQMVE